MGGVARLGDQISHGGNITSASSDVTIDGIGVARIGDSATCNIHGNVTITGGSSTVETDGMGTARIGDQLSCGAIITGGSPDVDCG
jgi:uncharacterized Zn-binding protein involved in type VI secretion